MDTYTARELRQAAGVTGETLDYWTLTRLVEPSTAGGFSAHQVSVAIVLADASRLGADGRDLAAIAGALAGDVAAWPDDLWLDARGAVRTDDVAPAAIVLHVRRVLARAAPAMLAAIAAA